MSKLCCVHNDTTDRNNSIKYIATPKKITPTKNERKMCSCDDREEDEGTHATTILKKVRFSSVPSKVVCTVPSVSEDARNQVWWNVREFENIRRVAVMNDNESFQYRYVYGKCLETAFSSPSQNKSLLAQWCMFEHSRRGLEREMCEKHRHQRISSRRKSRKAVLEGQKKKMNAVELASVYEGLTMASKKFASVMGEADAAAAQPRSAGSLLVSSPLGELESKNKYSDLPPTPTFVYESEERSLLKSAQSRKRGSELLQQNCGQCIRYGLSLKHHALALLDKFSLLSH
mmetsp:Transcript_24581/g.36077  ORF Transcript_24581/g.36077 Transcript_24581/m.36077 type:complete len:288 (-) Transcript_24581:315-1178(-)